MEKDGEKLYAFEVDGLGNALVRTCPEGRRVIVHLIIVSWLLLPQTPVLLLAANLDDVGSSPM